MASIPFVKVQGLGNDFLVIDLRPGAPAAEVKPSPLDPNVARALCDRHFGVGADGVLAIFAGDQGDARMQVINADGSEAEMCGNGIRCVAKVLYEKDPRLQRPVLRVETGAGLLECAMDVANGRVRTVAVQMGLPRLLRSEIPIAGPPSEPAVRATISARGRNFVFTAVSMGNPHAIIFIDDPAADLRTLAETYGPVIEVEPMFPRRTNVEFARVRGGSAQGLPVEVDLVVWERGVGITLACGTGACATAVAACVEGRIPPGREVPVHLPGGTLFITPDLDGDPAELRFSGVTMRGPAETVFEAEVDLATLPAT